jgi:hypothetical protein
VIGDAVQHVRSAFSRALAFATITIPHPFKSLRLLIQQAAATIRQRGHEGRFRAMRRHPGSVLRGLDGAG